MTTPMTATLIGETQHPTGRRLIIRPIGGCPDDDMTVPPSDILDGTITIVPTVGHAITICADEPGTLPWLEARRMAVTATDIPVILGLSQYKTARELWAEKLGMIQPEQVGEAALWGTLSEPMVADEWARRHDVTLSQPGITAHPEHRHHRASIDRVVHGCPDHPEGCILEIKTKSAFLANQWEGKNADGNDLPTGVEAQVAWQLHVCGLEHAHVACLLGGQRLIETTVTRDTEVEAALVARADEFYDCLQSGTEPAWDAPDARLIKALGRLFPDREGAAEVTDADAQDLIDRHADASQYVRDLSAQLKEARKAVEAVEAQMMDALGDAERAITPAGDTAWEIVTKTRRGYTVAPSTSKRLVVKH